MISTDTNKLLIPNCHAVYYSREKAAKAGLKQYTGISRIERDYDNAIIEFSSKIFPQPELITRENAPQALEIIEATGLVKLPSNALETACILRIDATNKVSSTDASQCLKLLKALVFNVSYRKEVYKRNDNITFRYADSTRGKYAIDTTFYNKSEESGRGENEIHVESRFKNSSSIKSSFDVYARGENSRILWLDVLRSDRNPNAELFTKIAANIFSSDFQNQENQMIHSQQTGVKKEALFTNTLRSKEFDLFSTLEKFAFDLNEIYLAKKGRESLNKSRAKILAPYAQVLQSYNLFRADLTPNYNLLLELREQLENPQITTSLNYLQHAA